jgi:signal transduction histidine kinase
MMSSINVQRTIIVLHELPAEQFMADLLAVGVEAELCPTTEALSKPWEKPVARVLPGVRPSEVIADIRSAYPSGSTLVIAVSATEAYDPRYDMMLSPSSYLSRQVAALIQHNQQRQHDIEALREAQKALQAAQSRLSAQDRLSRDAEMLKNALVHNVSHELRTPMLHLKSGVALMGEALREQAVALREFKYVEEAAIRLEGIITNLTMLGSAANHHPIPIVMKDVMETALRNLARSWATRDQVGRIHVHHAPHLPPVYADKHGLTIVLQLLIENALKFSEDQVDVYFLDEQDKVKVQITDYGIGMSADDLQEIFKMFYQADASATRRYSGMGIGLSIARLILDHHGAAITVESAPAKGTTFAFCLPVAALGDARTT